MSIKKIGHHGGLAFILIFSFVLLLVQQDSPASSRINSNEDDIGYRVKKSGHRLILVGGEDFQQLLQEARKLYNEMDYEGAIQKLMAAQGLAKTGMQKADLYFYLSLALYATQGERDRSQLSSAIEKVFVFDYQREPDPSLCPSGYVEIFNEIKASYGALKILSQPPGADVYINSNLAGKTPLMIGAKAGPIDVLVKKGKVEKQDQLEVTAGQETSSPIYDLAGKRGKFPIALVLAGVAIAGGAAVFALKGGGGNGGGGVTTGSIQVNSSPTGAKIFLDDKDQGKVTNSILSGVPVGSHSIKLVKDGYVDFQETVSVADKQTATVDASLIKNKITLTRPEAGTIWKKEAIVEIKWEVSSGLAGQAQNAVSGQSGQGARDRQRFFAQQMRTSRSLLRWRGSARRDLNNSVRLNNQEEQENLSGPQEILGNSDLSASQGSNHLQGRNSRLADLRIGRPPDAMSPSLTLFLPAAPSRRVQIKKESPAARVLDIAKVKIELYRGDLSSVVIIPETDNNGSFNTWPVPNTLANGSDYKVRVSCSTDSSIYGESSNITIADAWYEYVNKWGIAGNGKGQFYSPVAVAVDGSGYIYVADRDNHRIQKFTSDGGYVTKWGSNGSGNSQFNLPSGIAVDSSGHIYVVDNSNHRIQKFTSDGGYVTKWGSNGSGNSQFIYPVGVAVDGSGYVYVADANNHRIQKFTSDGGYVTQWGNRGSGNGQFIYPVGVAVDGSGYIYVADRDNHRIQKFNSDGGYVTKWGSNGSGNSQFINPWGVGVDRSGYVYVADTGNNRIQKFNSDGGYVTKWGSNGSGNSQFIYPMGVAVDRSGYVYVPDSSNNRIQKFK